ncbi:MAG: class I SAM-dependent RNA methyltransferase, partial [Vicinamibacteria bacterium]
KEELHYRNRLRFHVVFSGGRPIAGFRRGQSHEVVDVERCLLGSPTLNETWGRIRRALLERRPLARSVVSVELEESTNEPGRIAALFLVSSNHGLRSFETEEQRRELLSELGLEGMVAAVSSDFGGGPGVRAGRPFVEHRVRDLTLRQSVGSFFQSNRFLLQELVDTVLRDASAEKTSRGLDLFSGVGLFSLPLSRKLSSVIGVETESLALQDARENAKRSAAVGGSRVRFVRSDAASYLSRAKLSPEDFVILDPPRGGLAPELVQAFGESPLRAFRYVSCDPPALFRDALRLSAHGFAIESIALFDLFPNTHHFETIAVFSRRS